MGCRSYTSQPARFEHGGHTQAVVQTLWPASLGSPRRSAPHPAGAPQSCSEGQRQIQRFRLQFLRPSPSFWAERDRDGLSIAQARLAVHRDVRPSKNESRRSPQDQQYHARLSAFSVPYAPRLQHVDVGNGGHTSPTRRLPAKLKNQRPCRQVRLEKRTKLHATRDDAQTFTAPGGRMSHNSNARAPHGQASESSSQYDVDEQPSRKDRPAPSGRERAATRIRTLAARCRARSIQRTRSRF